jgi:hypothetical protein
MLGFCQADSSATQVVGENPSGTLNGVNAVFALHGTPVSGSLSVHRNGLRLQTGADYTLSGSQITFDPTQIPALGDILLVDYLSTGANAFLIGSGGLNLNSQTVSGGGTFTGPLTFSSLVTFTSVPVFNMASAANGIANGGQRSMFGADPVIGPLQMYFVGYPTGNPGTGRWGSIAVADYGGTRTLALGTNGTSSSNVLVGTVSDNGVDRFQVNGTVNASTVKTGALGVSLRSVTTTSDGATALDHTIVLSGTQTENLPASPILGQELVIVNAQSSPVTISGNGSSIWNAGSITSAINLLANSTSIIQWDGVSPTNVWRVIK